MNLLSTGLTVLLATLAAPPNPEFFAIEVVDEATGRGVPLVELTTVHNVRYYTDSAGLVAFHEPGLMNQPVFFHVSSHGYEYPKDGFGFRGARLDTVPGGRATIKIRRLNIAERLYRVTGAGIYRDSLLTGRPVPLEQGAINALVLGSDSVVNAVYRDRIYWFWGDTNRPSYPLGNFHVPGAVSKSPRDGGLDPSVGVDLEYFTDENGFAKPTAQLPGSGPTWLDGLVSVPDKDGRQRLLAKYVKIKPPLTVYERGLVEFDDQQQQFVKQSQFDMQAPLFPAGHPVQHQTAAGSHVYFATPYPLIRAAATAEQLRDISTYETYTCILPGSQPDSIQLDRDDQGRLRFAWRSNSLPLTPTLQQRLERDGRMRRQESPYRLRDSQTGDPIFAHAGSVYWNEYRQRWIMITVQAYGTSSFLGEVWYAEADQLEGPWEDACKIVTHDKYSFYNPKQHPMFDQQQGRIIYFEGTYVNTFSGNPDQTPRYDYNQIMYRLDLADPRLRPESGTMDTARQPD